MEVLNPRIDIVFKKIFGVEENKDLTVSLINSIVSNQDQVQDITLLNPYNIQSFKNDKLSILDIKAKGCNGKYFNIEIQVTDENNYDKRALYYWAKLYADQMKKGESYSKLQKTIGIHLLWFNSIPHATHYHNVFVLKEKVNNIPYFTDIELHTIELEKVASKLKGDLSNFAKTIKTSLDRWSAFLTKNELLNSNGLPNQLDNPQIKKAIEIVNLMSLNKEEEEAYEGRIKWMQMEASALEKKLEEGIEKGIAKGRAEGEEKIKSMIINMLNDKLPHTTIAKYTNVDVSVVEKISSELS